MTNRAGKTVSRLTKIWGYAVSEATKMLKAGMTQEQVTTVIRTDPALAILFVHRSKEAAQAKMDNLLKVSAGRARLPLPRREEPK